MDKKDKYWQLFLSTFKLSACTFGGGFVIIPLMRERFVKELHWIEEEEMLDLTAIAQSSPGSIAHQRLDSGGLPCRQASPAH